MTQQVALVTGGASGMGRACVARFVEQGFRVVIADLNEKVAQDALAELDAGDSVRFVRTDVSSEPAFEAAIADAVDTFGSLDVMVNAAGVGGAFGPLTEIEVDDWDYTMRVLLRSVFIGTKHAGRVMREQGTGGAIVNFGSIAGMGAGLGLQPYSVAKAGVHHLTRLAAFEFASDRIRVNAVAPGIVSTPFLGMDDDQLAPVVGSFQPLPVIGRPEYIAGVVAFLASQDAQFVTGQVVAADGGIISTGPQMGDAIGNNPALRGLVGVSRGNTGERAEVHRTLTPETAGR
jgi:NAD(P)-dependent dehydrogenase (short-subunit alcohol dehydrogenase family)